MSTFLLLFVLPFFRSKPTSEMGLLDTLISLAAGRQTFLVLLHVSIFSTFFYFLLGQNLPQRWGGLQLLAGHFDFFGSRAAKLTQTLGKFALFANWRSRTFQTRYLSNFQSSHVGSGQQL